MSVYQTFVSKLYLFLLFLSNAGSFSQLNVESSSSATDAVIANFQTASLHRECRIRGAGKMFSQKHDNGD